MFEWLYYMSLGEAMWIVVIIAAFNFIFTFWLRGYILKYYRMSGSLELTLNRNRMINQYIYRIIFFLSFISITLLCMFQLYWLVDNLTLQAVLALVFAYFIFGLILSVNKMVTYKVGKTINDAEEKRWEVVWKVYLGLLFLFIPMIITITFFFTLYQGDYDSFYSYGYLVLFELCLFMILFAILIPLGIGKSLKAVPMEDSILKDKLLAFIEKAGLSHVKLYVYPVKKSKKTNAMVTGYRKMRIYMADTLVEQFSEEQIESILAHEIGHIKLFHLWIRRGFIVLMFILFYGLVVVLAPYVDSHAISVTMGILIILCFIILSMGFGMRGVSRFHERQADSYVLKLGVDYRDFASALLKLAKLNHTITKMNKVDETFQTHPSFARRVKWIVQKANGSYEEIEMHRAD